MQIAPIGASEHMMLSKLAMGQDIASIKQNQFSLEMNNINNGSRFNDISGNKINANKISGIGEIGIRSVRTNSESPLAFSGALKGILDNVNSIQATAEQKITAVELGQSTDMIGATIAAQKAQLSFSALMQVRNKMVSNFNDIIKMPI